MRDTSLVSILSVLGVASVAVILFIKLYETLGCRNVVQKTKYYIETDDRIFGVDSYKREGSCITFDSGSICGNFTVMARTGNFCED